MNESRKKITSKNLEGIKSCSRCTRACSGRMNMEWMFKVDGRIVKYFSARFWSFRTDIMDLINSMNHLGRSDCAQPYIHIWGSWGGGGRKIRATEVSYYIILPNNDDLEENFNPELLNNGYICSIASVRSLG